MATKAAAAKKAPAKAPAKAPVKKAPAKKATVKKAEAPKKLRVAIIGCGGISHAHMAAYKSIPEVELVGFCDINPERLTEYQEKYGVKPEQCFEKWDDLFKTVKPEAVDICTPNGVHCPAAVAASEAGCHVMVEKPMAMTPDECEKMIAAAKKAGVKLQVGFNRRFDHNHRAVYEAIRAGKVGKVNLVKISSRDPEPPTIDYVKVSGGIFYDMMVHDFDMARFLAGSEVTEVFAYGAVLVDPAIGEAGDVDTAVVSLKFANGAMGVIDNSRKAVYGYDQRVEVFGSEGAVMDENDTPNNATYYGADGTSSSPCYKIMWDRYTMAFAAEQRAFAEAVINGTETQVTREDGLAPILIAAAATKSMKEGRPVKISEIEG